MGDPFARRVQLLVAGLLAVALVWNFLPLLEHWVIGLTAEPRPVTARGDLSGEERTTVSIFKHASPSVVYIKDSGYFEPPRQRGESATLPPRSNHS